VLVAHAGHPCYQEARDKEDCSLKPAPGKCIRNPIWKTPMGKKKDSVAQGLTIPPYSIFCSSYYQGWISYLLSMRSADFCFGHEDSPSHSFLSAKRNFVESPAELEDTEIYSLCESPFIIDLFVGILTMVPNRDDLYFGIISLFY
jgi:hypothetical protein